MGGLPMTDHSFSQLALISIYGLASALVNDCVQSLTSGTQSDAFPDNAADLADALDLVHRTV